MSYTRSLLRLFPIVDRNVISNHKILLSSGNSKILQAGYPRSFCKATGPSASTEHESKSDIVADSLATPKKAEMSKAEASLEKKWVEDDSLEDVNTIPLEPGAETPGFSLVAGGAFASAFAAVFVAGLGLAGTLMAGRYITDVARSMRDQDEAEGRSGSVFEVSKFPRISKDDSSRKAKESKPLDGEKLQELKRIGEEGRQSFGIQRQEVKDENKTVNIEVKVDDGETVALEKSLILPPSTDSGADTSVTDKVDGNVPLTPRSRWWHRLPNYLPKWPRFLSRKSIKAEVIDVAKAEAVGGEEMK